MHLCGFTLCEIQRFQCVYDPQNADTKERVLKKVAFNTPRRVINYISFANTWFTDNISRATNEKIKANAIEIADGKISMV